MTGNGDGGGCVRAAVQTGPGAYEMRGVPRPSIGPDEGLLRIEACGICGSDVEQYRGHIGVPDMYPLIPGHEPLGIIEEVGELAAERWGVRPGDRVAVEVMIPCGHCHRCLSGNYMSCLRQVGAHGMMPLSREPGIWGAFSEYMYLSPNSLVHKVRSDIPAEIAVLFNPLGAGVHWAYALGKVGLGDMVLILGAGQRGLAAVIASKAAGADTVIVTGLTKDERKLALAREFGADHTIDVEQENVVERVREITDGAMADVVLELTPIALQPIHDAIDAARHGGRIVLAGLKGNATVELATDRLISKGLTVVGAYMVAGTAYREAIRIVESGRFPLERMQSGTYALDAVEDAIQALGEGSAIALCVTPNDSGSDS